MSVDANYRSVGSALVEQDAEYLHSLIEKHKVPCRITQDLEQPLAEEGRSWLVQVQPMHLSWALEIRSNEFPEPAAAAPDDSESTQAKRPFVRTLFFGFVGAMVGLRVGVKFPGGGVVAMMSAGVVALLAMSASILFGSSSSRAASEDTVVAETEAEEVGSAESHEDES